MQLKQTSQIFPIGVFRTHDASASKFSYSKRWFLFGTFLFIMAAGQQLMAQAPLIDGAGVGANFGVDADLYANRLQFGYFNPWTTDTTPSGKDDYFKASTWAGSGIAVLDTV